MAVSKDLEVSSDFCPICKSKLSVMTREKDFIIRCCPTCKVIIQDKLEKVLPDEKK